MTYGGGRVFIGGISSDVSKDDIGNEFGKYGKLKNVWVAQNPPGFAFVEFDDDRDAEEAVKSLNGATLFNDNKIRVEHSKTRSSGGGVGGFSSGIRRGRGRGGMSSFSRGDNRQGNFRKNMNTNNFRSRNSGDNYRNNGPARFNKGVSRYNTSLNRDRPFGNRGAQSKFNRNKDGPPKFDGLRRRGGYHSSGSNHGGGSGIGRKSSGRNTNRNYSSGNNQNSFRKTSPMDL